MKFLTFCVLFISFSFCFASIEDNEIEKDCSISPELKSEIQSYQSTVNTIIQAVLNGQFKGATHDYLATFVDTFGPRFTGTKNLEDSIDYMAELMQKLGLENVRHENVTVPQWVRGNESATLIEPRRHDIRLLGLGYSVGTPAEGLQAEAIVVQDFDDLQQKGSLVKGKIVVYNQKYISYGETVEYRSRGASEASKLGAVAALIRSITPFSLNTPHTGMQTYEQNVTPIPVACISPEDAHMLHRMQNRSQKLTIHLKMGARNLGSSLSRNTIAELEGRELKDKVVLVSGHIDSWDVGQGAMDDGGGAFISWMSLNVLKNLGLRPKRTLRAVLWTAEEMGLIGAEQYVQAHNHELDKFNFVMESDGGTFLPTGLGVSGTDETVCIVKEVLRAVLWTAEEMGLIGAEQYVQAHNHELDKFNFVMESDIGTFWPTGLAVSGTDEAVCIVKEVLKLLNAINATSITQPQEGPDIDFFIYHGVPGASLTTKNDRYFFYHHTEADTMDVENTTALDLCTVVWASVSYVIADLSQDIPRK